MQCELWSRQALLIACVVFSIFAQSSHAVAGEDDPRLRKRIAELEAENRALRKLLTNIQNALKSVPMSVAQEPSDARSLRIVVMPGDWGDSELVDIRKVCESAAGTILAHLPDDGFAPILVERGTGSPITLFRRGTGHEHIVRLNTSNRAWAQCAYQFAHEFGHIVCNLRDVENPQLWFEETLCECASLFALQRMAVEWKANPPYSNWKSYSKALESYAADRIQEIGDRDESAFEFYSRHQKEFEKTATNRKLNLYIAVKLLPLFQKTPGAWQSLRYLNLGAPQENTTFTAYLAGWHDRVPEVHKDFVQSVAAEFQIAVSVPPADSE